MKRSVILRAAALVLAVAFIASGCGYTTGSLLPPEFKTIYVENFTNKIAVTSEMTDARMYVNYRPGMEIEVTKRVIDRFLYDGNLAIAQPDKADLILKTDLVDYRREALRYDANANVEEYRVTLVVDMELVNTRTGKTVWREKSFGGESTYRTGGTLVKTEDTAIRAAADDLARRIVERTVEAW